MFHTSKKAISCLKWDSDGELSIHDTHLLIKRLANSEKSRRTMLDHHELRRWRSRMSGDVTLSKTLSS